MGSLTRVFVMVFSCLTSPYVGLCLLAILFPFVHSKGVGVATVVTITFQLWHMAKSIKNRTTPIQDATVFGLLPCKHYIPCFSGGGSQPKQVVRSSKV
ncbi:hypothetical protein MTO96_040808 [Rhipicephalus appendiculatus]